MSKFSRAAGVSLGGANHGGALAILPMKNPPHPGAVVLHDRIEPLELTITEAAALT